VLIVDEINRGNISKILGELITLLEDDKRLGADNALTVTLPYSGEAFALPPNLFLLGTMNTADKSLALLDVALRRRFEFEEMPPRFEVCRDLSPAMLQVLEELNRRLTLARDREHRIGHAYFARVSTPEAFNHVFERKIVPLLQEFFLNDWDGLRAVLGESKASSSRFIRPLSGDDGARARTRWQWWTDEAHDKNVPAFSCFEALCLNYGVQSEAAPQVLEATQEPSEAA
jgi:5-methylcytosine-specific restriction protein B